MKAVVWTRYGPPELLEVREVDKPVPREAQVLVKVRAASVNPMDWHFMRGSPWPIRMMTGWRTPRLQLGRDVAGIVEAVGAGITEFAPGDEVFGTCAGGAFAEYVCASEASVIAKPPPLTFEQAAAVPIAGYTALAGLRDTGRVHPGQRVLINGAAGGVGTFAVQIAKAFGAEVTGVCSTRNVEMVRAIGADHVIDYTREDFTAGDRRYDVLLDNIGNHSLAACRRVLAAGGTHLLVGGPPARTAVRALAAPIVSRFSTRKTAHVMSAGRKADLTLIAQFIQAGRIAPVIDRRFRLEEIADAIRYLETGHARGKVVIDL